MTKKVQITLTIEQAEELYAAAASLSSVSNLCLDKALNGLMDGIKKAKLCTLH